MLLKENKIYLNGFTDVFTYNNVDYSLSNYDKDIYELYFKEVEVELIRFKCDILEFKNDMISISNIRQLSTPSHHEVEQRYKKYLEAFELYKTHFVIYLYTQKDTRDFYQIISVLKELWMIVDKYVISKCLKLNSTIKKEPRPYVKFLKIEEVPGRFTNTLKKLEESVFKGKLNNVIIENLKRF